MTLALYRKYRPARFADVVGQEHVTEPLSVALAAGRINHAYLFSGPRGCGKTSSARILARSLNCELGPTPEPCGACPSCVALAPGGPGNIDVTELDAASHGGVDDTRELRDRAFFAPAESRYRVFVVDEAHMITTQGFNALLKIVEEPPEHLVFVFATTEPDKVLPTIRSRTHHYPFRLIPPATLRALLERICGEEGAVVAPAVYPLVIRAGGGSARDSLSVLDQLLAGAGPEGVTYERAVALLGVTDVALIDDMVDALAAGDRAAVFEAVDRLVEAGHDPRRFAGDLLQRLRDLTLLQAVPEAPARGLVDCAEDEVARMVEQAARLGPATLARYGEIVHTGLAEMRGATAPRLLLELLCARMLLPAASTSEPALLERLERIERRAAIAPPSPAEPTKITSVGPPRRSPPQPAPTGRDHTGDGSAAQVVPAPGPAVAGGSAAPDGLAAPAQPAPDGPATPARPALDGPVAPARPATGGPAAPVEPAASDGRAAPAATSLDGAAVRRVWPEVLAAAKQQSRSVEAMLVNATVRAVEGDELVLHIGAPSLARRLSEQRNADVVAQALHAVLGVRWRVRCESGDAPPPARAATPEPRPAPPAPAAARRPPPRRRSAPEPGEPLPPEPPPEDAPPDDEESMIAQIAADGAQAPPPRRDPEEVAIELLSAQLGARTLDTG
ncbi:MAG: DNA polymerase III subunit gamma and tau [Pseudonocardia sp.]